MARSRRRLGKALATLGIVVSVLGVVAVFLLFFGGPERPEPTVVSQEEVSAAAEAPGGPLPFEGGLGVAPEGGVEMPLIPIPGCRCHSDDPVVVEEHSRYSLVDCAECH